MKTSGNSILITGGSTGIGLALAERFVKAGNQVMVCGRRPDKLEAAAKWIPGLLTFPCDVSKPAERQALFAHAIQTLPDLNILFNNAGVMRFTKLDGPEVWDISENEIATNLHAPIHLSLLFANHLSQRPNSAILNTTSGLAHVAWAMTPVYCATKAALHSFSLSLRHQYASKNIQVIEVCPPHVNTDLGAPGGNTAGMDLKEFVDAVMSGLANNDEEITVGFSTITSRAGRDEKNMLFAKLNASR